MVISSDEDAGEVDNSIYISMRAQETTVVVPNGSHYRDSQYLSEE